MFEINEEKLSEIIDSLRKQAESAVNDVCEAGAVSMECYAKANAPWTDRTGNARRTIESFIEKENHKRHIGVCGNMLYSPALEMLYGKKYAILYPTVQAKTGEIMAKLADTVIAVRVRKD